MQSWVYHVKEQRKCIPYQSTPGSPTSVCRQCMLPFFNCHNHLIPCSAKMGSEKYEVRCQWRGSCHDTDPGHMRRLSAWRTCHGPQNSGSPYDGGCTLDIWPVDQSMCHR